MRSERGQVSGAKAVKEARKGSFGSILEDVGIAGLTVDRPPVVEHVEEEVSHWLTANTTLQQHGHDIRCVRHVNVQYEITVGHCYSTFMGRCALL